MGKRKIEDVLHPNVDSKTPGAEAISALLYAVYGEEVVSGSLYAVHDRYASIVITPKSLQTAAEFRKIVDVATMPGVCVEFHVTDRIEVRISQRDRFRLTAPRRHVDVCEEVRDETTRVFTALQHTFIAQNKSIGAVHKPQNADGCGVGTARIKIVRDPDIDASDVFNVTRMCNYLVDPGAVDMWWEFEPEFISLFVRRRRAIGK